MNQENWLPATVTTRHNFATPSIPHYWDIFFSLHNYVIPGLAA